MKHSKLSTGSVQNAGGLFKPAIIVSALAVLGIPVGHAADGGKAVELPPVIVTATPFVNRSELDMAQPVTVLQGDDLRRKREASLGDTLSQELGVTSSSFGPAAGRPIIRGLDGPRIRVLEGGIGTLDISTLSPDHMVTTESLNATQIDVVRQVNEAEQRAPRHALESVLTAREAHLQPHEIEHLRQREGDHRKINSGTADGQAAEQIGRASCRERVWRYV